MLAVPSNAAPVAQWIEHLTSNLVAVGSNPAGRAIIPTLRPSIGKMWYPFQADKLFCVQLERIPS